MSQKLVDADGNDFDREVDDANMAQLEEAQAGKLPVRWEEELAKHAKQVAKLERPALSRVSLKAGIMTIGGVPVPNNTMDVLVLGSVFEKSWYNKPYNPDAITAPACFSFSEEGEEMEPHPKSFQMQSTRCDVCPKNQWGSAMRNGKQSKGKACADRRKLALIAASEVAEGKILKAEVAIVDLPVMSVANWGGYVNAVSAAHEVPFWACITRVQVKPDVKSQFKVWFDFVRPIEHSLMPELFKRREAVNDILTVPYEYNDDGTLTEQTAQMMSSKKY